MTKYTEEIRIRVSPENKAAIQAAADRANLDMSSWARTVLVRESTKPSKIDHYKMIDGAQFIYTEQGWCQIVKTEKDASQ